jgi:dihydropyrimidinase/allantoinase
VVDFGLIAGAGAENLEHIAGLADAGAVAFKTFTLPGNSANLIGCTTGDDGVLYDLFAAVARTGRPHNVHAESHPIIQHVTRSLVAQGRCSPADHPAHRPVLSEVEAFVRVMTLAGAAGVRLNFVHASSGSAVDRVLLFKQAGLVDVTVESCPHYLLLTGERLAQIGPYAKVNPPLRDEDERARLWAHLVSGAIDTIGSDHAPHPYEAIERGWQDITASPGGAPGLAHMLPVLLTEVNRGRLDLTTLVRLTAENAARLYGLYPRKGRIEVGADADLVLVDMSKQSVIGRDDQASKDPRIARMWEGYAVMGAPVMTILRGQIIMRDGRVIGQPGTGRFIAPTTHKPERSSRG